MVKVQVNPNFHVLGGKDILSKDSPAFKEYRKNWEERPKTFTAGEFPLHIDIETSCLCNLRCEFCATNYEPIGGKGFMSFETFKKIIDEGTKHGLCAIKLNSGGRGEPLLNPLVPEMIAYAKSKDIMDVYFNTNAMLLTRDMSIRLISSGLDRLSVSVEGTTAEVYEKYRIGASFDKVLNNIKEFIALRNEMGAGIPLMRIQTVALPELRPDLEKYKEFWGKIVDEVAFIDFKDYSHIQHNLIHDWACPYLWQRLMVRWDGTISACQFDYSTSYPLGNINEGDTIHSVWNGNVIKKLREVSKKGELHKISICNGCSFRTTEILKFKEGIK